MTIRTTVGILSWTGGRKSSSQVCPIPVVWIHCRKPADNRPGSLDEVMKMIFLLKFWKMENDVMFGLMRKKTGKNVPT